MNRPPAHSLWSAAAPALLAVSLFAVYLTTLAPGLTWANDGRDGGDLITAAATGGVAHPTGYPLYLLLARLFQLLPIGSLAYRTNLMSAAFAALAAALLYSVVTRSLAPARPIEAWPAGLAAGYAFGLAPLVWSQSVITEVHTLQALLVLGILHIYGKPGESRGMHMLRGLSLGLALANHVTAILLVPAAVLVQSLRWGTVERRTRLRLDGPSLGAQLAGLAIGLTPYLLIPLRALAHPPVNWGGVVTLSRFWWLISGGEYQGYYLEFSLAGIGERVQPWAALLMDQFGLPGLMLGVLGLVVFGSFSRQHLLTAWLAAASVAFAAVYRTDDFQVYLIPSIIAFAIWIGLGIGGLSRLAAQRSAALGVLFALVFLAYFAGGALTNASRVDASADLRAETFGRQVITEAPRDAMVFATGDRAVFTLWYFHFARGERPDLAVIAADLLHFDWYQETLRATYPSLEIPGPFPWPETIAPANPTRPACRVRYSDGAVIECSQ